MISDTFTTNNLKKFNKGGSLGDPNADSSRDIIDKLNYNFARVISTNGSFVGAGLRWTEGILNLAAKDNHILLGNTEYPLSSEFSISSDNKFSINQISGSKLSGSIDPTKLALEDNEIIVGSSVSRGKPISLNTLQFLVKDNKLSIKSITADAIANLKIPAANLSLGNRQIPIGESDTTPAPYTLGSEFKLIDNIVKIELDLKVKASEFLISDLSKNSTAKFLTKSTKPDNTDYLTWESADNYINNLVDIRVANKDSKNTIYVNPTTGTDDLNNPGTSNLSPFKTIQRALVQVVRNSYVLGVGTAGADLYEKASVYLAPGDYYVDNRIGEPTQVLTASPQDLILNNLLWQFNSEEGGIILPRGCSLIGDDLRKVNIIPIFIPNATQERSCIFKLTGGNYISQQTYRDNPLAQRTHAKLDCFRFASKSDLSLYYSKIFNTFAAIDNYSQIGGANLELRLEETQIVAQTDNPNLVDLNNFSTTNSVASASPYIFNVSLRSKFGLCGALIDGNAVSGLKSIVASQFTNVSLQVDPLAYTADPTDILESKKYIEKDRHYAFKIINNAYAQLVSCFAIGNALHYAAESGGEISITNSCSNFGGISLYADKYALQPLPQDTGFSILRILPPQVIEPNVKEFVVGTLDAANVTNNKIAAEVFEVDPIKFYPDTYIWVRVPNPSLPGKLLDLKARLININGSTLAIGGDPGLYVTPGTDSQTENSIYNYLNCLGSYEFKSTWFDPLFPPIGGEPVARTNEIQIRKRLLQNSSLFVKRIVENRTEEERNYHLIVSIPPNSRPPTVNYILNKSQFKAVNRAYFVAAVKEVPPEDLTGDEECCTVSGSIYQITVLRANRPEELSTLGALGVRVPDLIEDLTLREDYKNTLANLDPNAYPASRIITISADQNSITYKSVKRLCEDLGLSATQINTVLTPTSKGNLPHRYRILPQVPGVITNSSTAFDLLKPSLIRCSGHTWEWVGYRNYTTALPNLQIKSLPETIRLTSMQTALNGGRIYATGMDELGNLYQGRSVISLSTGKESKIRFDGVQQIESNSKTTASSFANLDVSDTLRASNANISNFTVGNLIFKSNSAFKVLTASGNLDLTETNCPAGIKARPATGTQEAVYGLVRKPTPAELTSFTGNGYLTPGDLVPLKERVDKLVTNPAESYVVFPNGLKIYCGEKTIEAVGNPIIVNFPTADPANLDGFPGFTQPPNVQLTLFGTFGGINESTVQITALTKDSFNCSGKDFGGAGGPLQVGWKIMWFAMGF